MSTSGPPVDDDGCLGFLVFVWMIAITVAVGWLLWPYLSTVRLVIGD